eukprot:gene18531-25038_t
MAKSLTCKDCSKLLASVKEAQDHAEVSGHSNFEETTEAIKIVMCTSCGKPCRTEAEQQLHSRANPGHDTFVEKTDEAAVLETEEQMKAARAEAMDTDEAAVLETEKQMKAARAEAMDIDLTEDGKEGGSTEELRDGRVRQPTGLPRSCGRES